MLTETVSVTVQNPNIETTTGSCECCGADDTQTTVFEVVASVDDISRGTTICDECWMWGCDPNDETCIAEEELSEEWPP